MKSPVKDSRLDKMENTDLYNVLNQESGTQFPSKPNTKNRYDNSPSKSGMKKFLKSNLSSDESSDCLDRTLKISKGALYVEDQHLSSPQSPCFSPLPAAEHPLSLVPTEFRRSTPKI